LCRARLALDAGEPRRAIELAERVLRQTSGERKLDGAPVLALLVRAHVGCGSLEEAGAALESLREIARLVSTEALGASVELSEGLLAAAGGDHDQARTLFEDAADRFCRVGAPFEAAQARIDLARSLAALGRHEAAGREAAGGLDRLLELGAGAEADRARRLVPGACEGPELPGVTPREREVLGLLAEGLTNRQIAGRLVVSEHTVHRHVTNILRKLNLPSRTAAAAYAVRADLRDTTRT
jgi:ATP/maltotriose-dependent transcriptional regulator MalT